MKKNNKINPLTTTQLIPDYNQVAWGCMKQIRFTVNDLDRMHKATAMTGVPQSTIIRACLRRSIDEIVREILQGRVFTS